MPSIAHVKTVVVLALIVDLLAFTIPLPLFPRIIEWYTQKELGDTNGLLYRTLASIRSLQTWLHGGVLNSRRQWDVVLLGGFLGSVFSVLQFVVSPWIGSLSDAYGRKPILLISMIGNIVSAVVWMQSTSFTSFLLARATGGFSEGNVQLSIAILSDVTEPANRARALALVGLAFALCFSTGPVLGAYFAQRPFPLTIGPFAHVDLNIYATPAALTVILLTVETIFLVFFLPETRGYVLPKLPGSSSEKKSLSTEAEVDEDTGFVHAPAVTGSSGTVQQRLTILNLLRWTHFAFLSVFSGVEFTLTFLTFDLFDWNNSQNGRMLAFIGVISALLQGGYVRRSIRKTGEGVMARRGVMSCVVSFAVLAVLPHAGTSGPRIIYAAAVCLAYTSATVVNSLTALASLQCDEPSNDPSSVFDRDPRLLKGRALGEFRSAGQLGRAIGPLLACAAYWTVGPSFTYGVSALAMFALSSAMRRIAVKPKTE
ncbi:MFS DHA1 sub-family [Dacryopinax primogenitus]|uniref:MFS DHA1 sub-family n=1 Tax=Dacryopinax primogenitus (strain DJM 731) TaxID=1858805 RepID=M5GFG5_DACPD|nr:MFS DHA1 sub-family [Dacryopinax primogenitus]EJU06267.1 MFS DHA1 sub-family [Dacryopinax primogenitus]